MREGFTSSQLYKRLPYGTTVPSHCPNLPAISFDLRVDPDWIEQNLANTPFTPVGDRIFISASDYSNNAVVPFKDIIVIVPMEYKGKRGGHPIVEFENLNRLVMGGREKWGYPKLVSDISFDRLENGGIRSVVKLGSTPVVELEWTPDATVTEAEPLNLTPHYLLRLLPDASREGMGFAEVLNRDTSSDVTLLEKKIGKGSVKFNKWPQHELDYCGLADLEIKEIVSATFTTSDWHATEENGWARLVDRIL
ncbi:MAG: hypothetical protein CMM78_11105 [Rhodospirillaceae bacterium]|jgi:acetoacetate decarboxylase|uniref:acetoacetate decarboxylase family protein n=1 Tax=Hwanghaeella sp. 1Z406 TaxID=3402811 RepID=UPI000C5E9EE4|nr:hypothetical protein [Rhodospirillales bacterium]MAX48748.1 hypothetical protein [Rhodospirillaceae bacterium]|tara:strand:+ start:25292 stop:26044 length:753 start_codon:yes stop_codon:yes gene_type:complete